MTATAAFEFFSRSVRERAFTPKPDDCRRVGLEVELLSSLADSGLPCPLGLLDAPGPNTLDVVRRHGSALGWKERQSSKGAPYFTLPNGSTLTFEPGGQLELCTPPHASLTQLLGETRATLGGLRRAAADAGITLSSVGIDPQNPVGDVPLQIPSDRYVRMTRYFEGIGPSGIRMMRQTAATQISFDAGGDPAGRWRLLADVTPYLTAMFANSPRYAGADTGCASFRARCWRRLDPTRTGVPEPFVPACEAYTRFALDAHDMWREDEEGGYRAFGEWVERGQWSEAQWDDHLSTLFPEVRPRGYLEVRSIDALGEEMLGAPLILLAGLVYDPRAAADARRLVPHASEELLERAAQYGMRDRALAETANALVTIGLCGARALGESVIAGRELERAAEWFADWTRRERSPADAR